MNTLRTITLGVLAAASVAGVVGVAHAQTAAAKAAVDAAKAQGTVGEQGDGYLGIVSGGDGALQSAVREINAGRAAAYREIAAKTGVTPEAAGQATAEQLRAKLRPGQFFKPLNGGWTRK
jgi:uncharacterized protein YdbL (DUF1318 family)